MNINNLTGNDRASRRAKRLATRRFRLAWYWIKGWGVRVRTKLFWGYLWKCISQGRLPSKTNYASWKKRQKVKAKGTLQTRRVHRDIRDRLFILQNGICLICNRPMMRRKPKGTTDDYFVATVDHIIPVSRGGTKDYNNLRMVHGKCNGEKANRIETRAERPPKKYIINMK